MPNEGLIVNDSTALVKSEIVRQIRRLGSCSPDELERAVFEALVGRSREEVDWEIEDNQAGYYTRVKRKADVRVRYTDLDSQQIELETDGLLAIAFQHEIDHLDGILFVDHLSSLKKGIFKKKYQKILEQLEEQL